MKPIITGIILAIALIFAILLSIRSLGVPVKVKIMVCLRNSSNQILNDVVVSWPSGKEELGELTFAPNQNSYRCLTGMLPATSAAISFRGVDGVPKRIEGLKITGMHSSVIHINEDLLASVSNHTGSSP